MSKEISRRKLLKYIGATALSAGTLGLPKKSFSQSKRAIPTTPVKVAAVSFLTGAAAAPFGIPGDNVFKMCADKINADGGILGRKVELHSKDEAGGVDAQVKLCRKLILEDKMDVVLGYISSADCLAVLPLADELSRLKAFAVFAFCAEITRLPGHCAPRLTPENATAQTMPSRSTMVAHI